MAEPFLSIITILVGIVLLVAGRKLFWLAIGALGFLIGLSLALNYLAVDSAVVLWLIAFIAGVVGAVVAIFLQQVAVVVGGFLMGGYLSLWLIALFNLNLTQWEWMVFIIGGIIGAIIVSMLFEYALIGLSSLVGATMISQSVNLSPQITTVILIALFVLGLVVQMGGWIPSTSRPRSSGQSKR
ncbi:MAG: DUF4203 domain-containing protein [Anaerolineae bacterium]|nr:DUF4203 domain-containing protein [Anaerolineae bacterium]